MKVLIFIEVDVVVRHFIQSRAFADLIRLHDVAFVFPEPGHRRMGNVDPAGLDLGRARRLTLPEDMTRLKLWRWLFHVGRLRGSRSMPPIQLQRMRELFLDGNGRRIYLLYRALGLPGVFSLLRAIIQRRLRNKPPLMLEKLLATEQPDVIVHPCVLDGTYINDLVETGQKAGIPVVVVMNSWDNPATKRAVVGTGYHLLVWGPQTVDHAVRLMGMPAERVTPFGAAQFDVYDEPPGITRDDFAARTGSIQACRSCSMPDRAKKPTSSPTFAGSTRRSPTVPSPAWE
ncbi:MAG: hypothetical protein HC888_04055 [Candidatus Competibacteraceae bacterium]|nr:hypothetical protein [Candidatus Competibacteraceae bacterium]